MHVNTTVRSTAPAIPASGRWSLAQARLLPYLGVAALTVVLGLPTLVMPLHPDQALFVMIGRTIALGGFPYVDAWDQKPPAIYLLYALATRLPFDVTVSVRLFDLGWTAITAVLIFELGRRYWSSRAGLIAALVFALVWSTGDPWWQSAQPDSLLVLPLVLGLLLYDAARGRAAGLVAAGLAFGIAFQLRFNIAFFLPLLPFVELASLQSRPTRRLAVWFQRMAWLGVGFVLIQVGTLLYLAAGGALGEFLGALRYAAGYTRTGGPWNPPEGPAINHYLTALRTAFWSWAGIRLVLIIPALAAGAYGWFVVRERRVQQLILFSLLTYAGIALQAKFFWYHYGYLVPLLALIGGWGWDRFLQVLRRSQSRLAALLTTVTLVAVLVLASPGVWDSGVRQWQGLMRSARDPQAREAYRTRTFQFVEAQELVAEYIRDRTRPGDHIYVWGYDPLIYLEVDRPSASRFLLSFALMSDWVPPRWQEEFIAELERTQPVYIVVERGQAGNWIVGHNIDMADYIGWFPAFQLLLERDYEQETELAGAIIYRRRSERRMRRTASPESGRGARAGALYTGHLRSDHLGGRQR